MELASDRITSSAPTITIKDLRTHCLNCSTRELCLPVGLNADEMQQVDALIVNRIKLDKNETLYRVGEPFHALYAIRVGSLKTKMLVEDGREQVAGYHMPGEIIGLDGVGTDRHGTEAIALEDSEVCVMPFVSVEDLARSLPALQQNLHKVMSREIAQEQSVMLLLGSMRAEERLAAFLLNLSDRYRCRGYSATEYVLRMTRKEIGSYLGLKHETVSRLFSHFQKKGFIRVHGRTVKLLDPSALMQVAGQRG
jgi:CRP/FNR family transcriptional regulator